MRNCQKVPVVCNAVVSLIFCALIAGCVSQPSAPETKKSDATVFYPGPPDPPRYQFLTSFKGAKDFESKSSGMSSFLGDQAVTGDEIKKPYGLFIRQGVIYLADSVSGIFQFDLVNRKFFPFKGSKGLGKIVQPMNLATDKEGNTYVCDPVRKQVMQYDKNDFYVRAFVNAEDWKPVDAEVYEDRLYVADSMAGTGGVKVFNLKTGTALETIGLKGTPEQKLGIAANIAFDKDGFLNVVDVHQFKIMRYDRDGHYRGSLGGPGDSPGYFGRPRGVAMDRAGRMYVVDAAFDVVQVFAPTGQMVIYFGNEKDVPAGSLTLPAAIYIDYDNIDLFKQYAAPGFEIEYLILVSSQFNKDQAINVYGYGRMAGAKYKSDQELYQDLLEKIERDKANSKVQ